MIVVRAKARSWLPAAALAAVRTGRRYCAMLTRPERSAVTAVHCSSFACAGSASAGIFAVSYAGLNSHVVSVSLADAGSGGGDAGAVVSAGDTTTLAKFAPPRLPQRPTMPRAHGRLSAVTVSCGSFALSTKRRAE